MNFLIQRGKVRNQMINVPPGLPELLSDITREVLRCQPTTECLCQFIIDYLHSVIVTREKARVAKSIIDRALSVVDEIIADMCICDISKAKAQEMAIHMEECFRRFLSRMRCEQRTDIEVVRFEEQDMLNAMIERCKFTDEELKISQPMIEAAYRRFADAYMKAHEDFEGTEELYQYFKQRELKRQEEDNKRIAATRIQASFRGYIVRRALGRSLPPVKKTEEEFGLDFTEIENRAAVTIQKAFRRHLSMMSSKDLDLDKIDEVCEPGSQIIVSAPGIAEEHPTEMVEQTAEEVPLEATQSSQEAEVALEAPIEPEPKLEHEAEHITEPEPEPQPEHEPALEPEPQTETKPEQSEPPPDVSGEVIEEHPGEEAASPNEAGAPKEG
ncbi:pinin [Anastrepha ludens]|uniref:pinin n=1 Tax=Anastrepha ludens TaxID=28586 RepID=UPI0023B14165|nr:pinin [Anastrepha ludens]